MNEILKFGLISIFLFPFFIFGMENPTKILSLKKFCLKQMPEVINHLLKKNKIDWPTEQDYKNIMDKIPKELHKEIVNELKIGYVVAGPSMQRLYDVSPDGTKAIISDKEYKLDCLRVIDLISEKGLFSRKIAREMDSLSEIDGALFFDNEKFFIYTSQDVEPAHNMYIFKPGEKSPDFGNFRTSLRVCGEKRLYFCEGSGLYVHDIDTQKTELILFDVPPRKYLYTEGGCHDKDDLFYISLTNKLLDLGGETDIFLVDSKKSIIKKLPNVAIAKYLYAKENLLAACQEFETRVALYDFSSDPKCIGYLNHPNDVCSFCFHPTKNLCATKTENNLYIWELNKSFNHKLLLTLTVPINCHRYAILKWPESGKIYTTKDDWYEINPSLALFASYYKEN